MPLSTHASNNAPGLLCLGLTPCFQRTLFFDGFRSGEVNRAVKVETTPSGKAVNVAKIIRSLGGRSIVTGFLGGEKGRWIEGRLRDRGIACDCVATSSETRICQTLIDSTTGLVTELVEEAINPTEQEWARLNELLPRLIREVSWLVVMGSPPPGSDPGFYRRIIEIATGLNVRTLIDTQKLPLQQAVQARPFLAKCNQEELGKTLDLRITDLESLFHAMRKLLALGAENALVTRGRDPAFLANADGIWKWEVPGVEAVNPIGSGDAVMAGLAHGLASGDSLNEGVTLGIACGVANALTSTSGEIEVAVAQAVRSRIQYERVR